MKLVGVVNTERTGTEHEAEYYLRLEDTNVFIKLRACDKNGDDLSYGVLLIIDKATKRITLAGGVDPTLGFPLDQGRRLIING